ncbi:MAG: M16 family metallopeptidase [Hyphomicrobiales bacterium]
MTASRSTVEGPGDIKVTTLPSGLRVATDPMPLVETVRLGVWVDAGSRDERPQEHGMAHLLEHMAFKGTSRRSAKQIAEEIEAVGGDLNAMTSSEQTAFVAKVLAADTSLALDILSDILLEPSFEAEELRREQDVVVQEIGAYRDSPEELVHDYFTEAAFPGQAIGRTILGTPESVTAFDRHAVAAFLERNYKTAHTVVAAAGKVEHERFADEVERLFAKLSDAPPPASAPADYLGGEMREDRRAEQAHVMLGFGGVSYLDDAHDAVQVFTSAVGGGMSSRLFQDIRETRGLAYSIYAFHAAYRDTGAFGVYAGTDPQKTRELAQVTLDVLARAAEELTETEIRRAKAQSKVALLSAQEAAAARASFMARSLLAYDRVLSREELTGRIDKLSVEDVRAAGRALLATPLAVAAVGPLKKLPRIAMLANHLHPSELALRRAARG